MYRLLAQHTRSIHYKTAFPIALVFVLILAVLLPARNSLAVVSPGPILVDDTGAIIQPPGIDRNKNVREILIKFKRGVGDSARRSALQGIAGNRRDFGKPSTASKGARALEVLDQLSHAKLADNVRLSDALVRLRANPNVLYAEPNYEVHALTTPNDTQFGDLWGLYNLSQTGGTIGADIRAKAAWDTTTGSADVVVAVIDTGIDYITASSSRIH